MSILTIAAALAAVSAASAGEKKPAKPAAKPDGSAAASVLRLSGSVRFRRAAAAADAYKALEVKTALFVRDEVRTGRRGSVELKLADGAKLTLGAQSSLVIRAVRTRARPDATLLDLDGGSLGMSVDQRLAGRQRFEVATPVAVCGVRGTRFAVTHENPRGGRRGNRRGTTQVTVGTGRVNVKCLNPIFAAHPGVLVGRNQILWVTWQGFGRGKPADVRKRHLRRLMDTLPGWVPDPADPNLLRPLPREDGAVDPRKLRPGSFGKGAYDSNGGGFHNAVGTAILGDVGLTRGTPMGRLLAGGRQTGGDSGGTDGSGSDPVNPQMVRPGQPVLPDNPFADDVIVNFGADDD
jgi:hypothetical protein